MAATQDDAFREIQLSGKQVVFVFMAGLVIAVVIFLIGVQVGRGVLAQRGLPEAADLTANADEPAPPPASASPASSTAPVTSGEKLSVRRAPLVARACGRTAEEAAGCR